MGKIRLFPTDTDASILVNVLSTPRLDRAKSVLFGYKVDGQILPQSSKGAALLGSRNLFSLVSFFASRIRSLPSSKCCDPLREAALWA